MATLVFISVDDDQPARGLQRITVTMDVPSESAWDAVSWAVEQLGSES